MSAFDAAALAQIAGAHVRPGIFFRLATPTLVRLWSGVGNYPMPADAVEPSGATYKGGIPLASGLPALNSLINGLAERVTFGLSGVDDTALGLADADAADIRGARVHLGVVFFGEDWQPLSATAWLWSGTADTITPEQTPADQSGASVRTIALSVGSAYTARRRPQLSYWTDQDQRRRSASDDFCERVAANSPAMIKTWPRF